MTGGLAPGDCLLRLDTGGGSIDVMRTCAGRAAVITLAVLLGVPGGSLAGPSLCVGAGGHVEIEMTSAGRCAHEAEAGDHGLRSVGCPSGCEDTALRTVAVGRSAVPQDLLSLSPSVASPPSMFPTGASETRTALDSSLPWMSSPRQRQTTINLC